MSSTYDNPEIIYPQNSTHLENIDFISPSDSPNDPLTGSKTSKFNESWHSWNSTSSLKNSNQHNINGSQYNSQIDESQSVMQKQPIITDRIGETKFVRGIYAKKWKNYEAADRILNPGTKIVAMRRRSKASRVPKLIPIPIGLA